MILDFGALCLGGVDGRAGKDFKIFWVFLGISRWDSVRELQSNCKTFLH